MNDSTGKAGGSSHKRMAANFHLQPLNEDELVVCVRHYMVRALRSAVVIFLLTAGLALAPPLMAAGDSLETVFLHEDSFENPRIKQRYVVHGNQRIELVEYPVRDQRWAARFRVNRHTDSVPYRSEFSFKRFDYEVGRTYWYAFSIFIPHDWVDDAVPAVVAQWPDHPDAHLGEIGRAPPINLNVVDSTWTLRVTWDSKRLTPKNGSIKRRYTGRETFSLGELKRGRWTDWVFRINWSFGQDGLTQVWKDGREVLQHEGPNAYNDARGPYFKFGLYIPQWNRGKPYYRPTGGVYSHEIFFDRFRVADERGSLGLMQR